MSRKLWSGLISVSIIFIVLQVMSNIHKQVLEDKQPDAQEIVIDMASLNAVNLAKELEPDSKGPAQILVKKEAIKNAAQIEPEQKLPKDTEQIQAALKAAGFDPGKIDGKMGEKTKIAIRAFQKTHDLKIDGKIGRNTWALLKRYLRD